MADRRHDRVRAETDGGRGAADLRVVLGVLELADAESFRRGLPADPLVAEEPVRSGRIILALERHKHLRGV